MPTIERFLHPDVQRHLLDEQDEYIIDEVSKHWITVVVPMLVLVACIPLFLSLPGWGRLWPVPVVLGVAGAGLSIARMHDEHMDRFVITNMRVFRVHGVFNQHLATTPLNRILDINVRQPFWGQLLGYGHFIFESAAEKQGLREITYVAHPEQRDSTIETVIQAAGLRKTLDRADFDKATAPASEDDDGT